MSGPGPTQAQARQPLIDVLGLFYERADWDSYLRLFIRRMPAYMTKFADRFCAVAGVERGIFLERLGRDPEAAVDLLIEAGGGFNPDFDAYAADLEAQGVRHQILHGRSGWGALGEGVNERVAGLAARRPDLFSAWSGLSLAEPEAAARELERCVRDLGMGGASITPMMEGIAASDPANRPIFDMAVALDVPVWIHTGHNFNNRVPLNVSHCRHLDRIATAYPTLRMVAGHGGWPWMDEMVVICQRHSGVFLDLSSHLPRFMPKPGSCWAPFLLHAAGVLRRRVLFGTSAWVSPLTIRELAQETADLPIPAAVAEDWLFNNAAREFGVAG